MAGQKHCTPPCMVAGSKRHVAPGRAGPADVDPATGHGGLRGPRHPSWRVATPPRIMAGCTLSVIRPRPAVSNAPSPTPRRARTRRRRAPRPRARAATAPAPAPRPQPRSRRRGAHPAPRPRAPPRATPPRPRPWPRRAAPARPAGRGLVRGFPSAALEAARLRAPSLR